MTACGAFARGVVQAGNRNRPETHGFRAVCTRGSSGSGTQGSRWHWSPCLCFYHLGNLFRHETSCERDASAPPHCPAAVIRAPSSPVSSATGPFVVTTLNQGQKDRSLPPVSAAPSTHPRPGPPPPRGNAAVRESPWPSGPAHTTLLLLGRYRAGALLSWFLCSWAREDLGWEDHRLKAGGAGPHVRVPALKP